MNIRSPKYRDIKTAALFAAGMIAILFFMERLFDHFARADFNSKPTWILSKEGGNYGFAILGSSKGYVTVDCGILERQLGISGINLSMNGCSVAEQYLVLDAFLKRNSVRNLLFEVDMFGLDSTSFTYPFHDYLYLPFISDSTVHKHLLDYFGWKVHAWEYIPFYKYAEYNTEIGTRNLVHFFTHRKPNFDQYGSELIDSSFNPFLLKAPHNQIETYHVSAGRENYFKEILSLARRNNIRIILFTSPEYDYRFQFETNRAEMTKYYTRVADSLGTVYLNFDNDTELCGNRDLFKDYAHLNKNGARIFSAKFGELLRSLVSIK
jgi:hypothetical protein